MDRSEPFPLQRSREVLEAVIESALRLTGNCRSSDLVGYPRPTEQEYLASLVRQLEQAFAEVTVYARVPRKLVRGWLSSNTVLELTSDELIAAVVTWANASAVDVDRDDIGMLVLMLCYRLCEGRDTPQSMPRLRFAAHGLRDMLIRWVHNRPANLSRMQSANPPPAQLLLEWPLAA